MDIRRSGESPNQSRGGAEQKDAQQTTNKNNTGIVGPMLMIFVLIILAVAGIYLFGGTDSSDSTVSGPVARVGGEPIEAEAFNEQLSTLRESTSSQAQQFQSLSETRQQELILSGLINQELLRQAAVNAGVSVSDSEVDSRLQSQIEQIGGESEFEQRLSENGLTREEVRENLRQQMLISAYVEQTSTTTDEQIQQLYDQYRSQLSQTAGTSSQNVPSLEQLRPRLEASIQQQNRQQLLQQARNDIEVEVLLEGVSYPPTSQTQTQPQPGSNNQPNQQPSESGDQATTSSGAETEGVESPATGSTAQ